MKLRNKKTGEIMDDVQYRNYSLSDGFGFRMNGKEWEYHSLAELNEEWEDYEEPKEEWYINCTGEVLENNKSYCNTVTPEKLQSIGNYFETKEEAEKAVEKLKAWKRVKDKGVELYGWRKNQTGTYDFLARWKDVPPKMSDIINDLDLLFGGEE